MIQSLKEHFSALLSLVGFVSFFFNNFHCLFGGGFAIKSQRANWCDHEKNNQKHSSEAGVSYLPNSLTSPKLKGQFWGFWKVDSLFTETAGFQVGYDTSQNCAMTLHISSSPASL